MSLVTYKDVCIDAVDVSAMAGFWSRTLGLTSEMLDDGDAVLKGDDPSQVVWINSVPEALSVKQRVHIDVNALSLDPFAGLEQQTEVGEFPWTVFLDPEGGEFCVFLRDEVADYLLYEVVVDAVDHQGIAEWWAGVIGGDLGHDRHGYSWIEKSRAPRWIRSTSCSRFGPRPSRTASTGT